MNAKLNITGLKVTPPFLVSCDVNPAANNYEFVVTDAVGRRELGRQNLTIPALDLSALATHLGDYSVMVTASDDKDDGETAKASFTAEATGIVNFKEVTPVAATTSVAPAASTTPATAATPATTVATTSAPTIAATAVAPATTGVVATTTAAPATATVIPATTATAATPVATTGTTATTTAANPVTTTPVAAMATTQTTQAVQPAPWYIRYRMRILVAIVSAVILGGIGLGIRWLINHQTTTNQPDGNLSGLVALQQQVASLQEALRQQQSSPTPATTNKVSLAGAPGINNVEIKAKGNVLLQSPVTLYEMPSSMPTTALKAARDMEKLVSELPMPGISNCVLFRLKPEEIAGSCPSFCSTGVIGLGDFGLVIAPPGWTYNIWRSLDETDLVIFNDGELAKNVVPGYAQGPIAQGVSQVKFWLKPGCVKRCEVKVTFLRPLTH